MLLIIICVVDEKLYRSSLFCSSVFTIGVSYELSTVMVIFTRKPLVIRQSDFGGLIHRQKLRK